MLLQGGKRQSEGLNSKKGILFRNGAQPLGSESELAGGPPPHMHGTGEDVYSMSANRREHTWLAGAEGHSAYFALGPFSSQINSIAFR